MYAASDKRASHSPSHSSRPSAAQTSLYVFSSLPFVSFRFWNETDPVSNMSSNQILKTFQKVQATNQHNVHDEATNEGKIALLHTDAL